MMDNMNGKQSIRQFIAQTSYVEFDKIKDESLIFREGLFDSMGLMSLISFLEDEFKIQIKDTELIEENFESINAIYNLLQNKLK